MLISILIPAQILTQTPTTEAIPIPTSKATEIPTVMTQRLRRRMSVQAMPPLAAELKLRRVSVRLRQSRKPRKELPLLP